MTALAVGAGRPTVIYAGSDNGLALAEETPSGWTIRTVPGIREKVTGLAASSESPPSLYVATVKGVYVRDGADSSVRLLKRIE